MTNRRLLDPELMKIFMRSVLWLACLFVMVGCNKHRILDEERAVLEAEQMRLREEIADLDKRISAMPDRIDTTNIQKQIDTLDKKAVTLEAELAEQSSELNDIERGFSPLKAEAEAFLARQRR
jgi:septal ring factor EnvC (AmiA/AmiB activator)